jgi:uncharacterized protein
VKLFLAKVKLLTGCVEQFCLEERIKNFKIRDQKILLTAPVNVKGEVENLGNGFFQVTGTIKSTAEDLCYRCMCPTKINLNEKFNFKFSDLSVKSDEEDVFELDCDYIDLMPHVINEIILNWPSKIICSFECKGLCPHCGSNLNTSNCSCKEDHIDSRLSVLKKLIKEED